MMTTKQLVISLTYYKTFLIVCTDHILIFILVLIIYFHMQSDALLLPLAQSNEKSPVWLHRKSKCGYEYTVWQDNTIIMYRGVVDSYSFLCLSDLGFPPSVLSLIRYSAPFSFLIYFLKLMLLVRSFICRIDSLCFIFYSFLFFKFTSWAIYSNLYSTPPTDF